MLRTHKQPFLHTPHTTHTHTSITWNAIAYERDAAIHSRGKLKYAKCSHHWAHCSVQVARLLNNPFLNKGTAFTRQERAKYGLNGILPAAVDTIEEQAKRIYAQLAREETALSKNSQLTSLKERNLTLYYFVINQHLKELFPIIYTPTEGDAIENFSDLFQRPEGCFLSVEDVANIGPALQRFGKADDIDLLVCSDGEEILGIGDQGVGAILISIAKLAIYTACGGIHPNRVIPVSLDCGTNRKTLWDSKLYLGLRRPRARGKEYDTFIDAFLHECRTQFPRALVHFEDFGVSNARRILDKYSPQMACFNDDIEGTGCVALAAIYAASYVNNLNLKDARVVIFGAGSAGIGIADQIRSAIAFEGHESTKDAATHIWCIDKNGLVLQSQSEHLTEGQRQYAKPDAEVKDFGGTGLLDVIRNVKPHILIGCSTAPGTFTQDVVQEMARHVDRPVIFPLSNPTRLAEAKPEDVMQWTNGKALVATGSPFPPVKTADGKVHEIAECNNSTTFPGIGLGVILSRAKLVTPAILVAAVKSLASLSPTLKDDTAALLPDVTHAKHMSITIASGVIQQATKDGLAQRKDIPSQVADLPAWIEKQMWTPVYQNFA